MESKVKPNTILVIVKYGLDVVWYLSFVSIIILAIQYSTIKKRPNSTKTFSVEVEYHGTLSESHTSVYDNLNPVAFKPTHGKLEFSGDALPWNSGAGIAVSIALYTLCMSVLYFVFLFYLRKIFTSFLHHSPFCLENVKRIRIIAVCFFIFDVLLSVSKKYFIPQITGLTSYSSYTSYNFPGDYKYIIIGIIIFILADIFKYGFQIQDENNKFV